MRRYGFLVLIVLAAYFLTTGLAFAEAAKSATGKVTAIDPQGKAIVVETGKGKNALTIGAIVEADTKLKAKGKNVPASDLGKTVNPGDTVTIKWVKTDNLYAKEIAKK